MTPVRIDLHCHTHASPDGSLREKDVKHILNSGRLHLIAITDHNTTREAKRLEQVFGNAIIVGEEITTSRGEVIGLYLKDTIQPGLTLAQTVAEIKSQNGLVLVPHPFERVRKGISRTDLETITNDIDMIEVLNGRSFSRKAQAQAAAWARLHGKPAVAASDAHGRIGWGRVYSELTAMPTRETLVPLLNGSVLHGKSGDYRPYFYPALNRLRYRYRQ